MLEADCDRKKAECYQHNIKPIMDDLKSFQKEMRSFQINMIQLVAEMPEKIAREAEAKFANKNIEESVTTLKTTIETRNYEWLKYLITLILGALVAVFLSKIK